MCSSVFLTKVKMIHMGLLAGIPRFPSLISTGYFLVLECTGISNMDVLECTGILLKGYTGKLKMYWNVLEFEKKLGGHPVELLPQNLQNLQEISTIQIWNLQK